MRWLFVLMSFVTIPAGGLLWPAAVGGASVRGQVVSAATGLPLPRAVVIVRSRQLARVRKQALP